MLNKKINISASILAGGKSKRLGYDKILLCIDKKPIIIETIKKLFLLSSEIIISVANHEDFLKKINSNSIWKKYIPEVNKKDKYFELIFPCFKDKIIKCVEDIYPNSGSLGGIYSSLEVSKAKYTLVVGADMPFLSIKVLKYLKNNYIKDKILVPEIKSFFEPLLAIYPKLILPELKNNIKNKKLKISNVFKENVTAVIEPDKTPLRDLFYISVTNINKPSDLKLIAKDTNINS